MPPPSDAWKLGAIRTFPVLPAVDENGVERACDAIGVENPVVGTLEGDQDEAPDSIWLGGRDGPLHVVWPAGFSARFSPAAELLDAGGRVVAVERDTIELQVSLDTAQGSVDRPYVASGILLGGCYLPRTTLTPASVAVSVVDGVRVRSEPSVDDSSEKYSPLLPVGTDLFVIDGPTVASGYEWWQVVPVSFADLQGPGYGWVAAASREGDPWIEAGDLKCPAPPGNLTALAALSDGMALACFARQPITVRARLVSCNCDVDGPGTRPGWLGLGGQPSLLVDPSDTEPPVGFEDWFILYLDPDAGVASLPVDEIVDVTGIFDHPAAEGCVEGSSPVEPPDYSQSWSPTLSCRFAFAVTELKVVDP